MGLYCLDKRHAYNPFVISGLLIKGVELALFNIGVLVFDQRGMSHGKVYAYNFLTEKKKGRSYNISALTH